MPGASARARWGDSRKSPTSCSTLPMHAIVRVEEVDRQGVPVVRDAIGGDGVVTPFPYPAKPR